MKEQAAAPRRRTLIGSIAAAAAGLLVAGTIAIGGPANAATADGWIRIGHLSPNTKGVDVSLTALSGGSSVFSLDDVTYGQVSPYKELAAGTYVLAMRASNAPKSTPVVSTDVTVSAGKASTVVAYGLNSDLKTAAYTDDLTQPGDGKASLRLVQAATTAKQVDVRTTSGTVVAQNAQFGSATKYATIDAGSWKLQLTGGGASASSSVDLKSNTVSTLFVLDNSAGDLTIVPVTDSAATASTPKGGVQTGGGGTAHDEPLRTMTHAFVRFLHTLFH